MTRYSLETHVEHNNFRQFEQQEQAKKRISGQKKIEINECKFTLRCSATHAIIEVSGNFAFVAPLISRGNSIP